MTQTPVLPPEIPDQNHEPTRDTGKVRAESPGPSPTPNPIATVPNEKRSAATVVEPPIRADSKPSNAELAPSKAELTPNDSDTKKLAPPQTHAKGASDSSLQIAYSAKYAPSAS
ncbi:MAG: hypothetical protein ACK5O8_05475, partial [Pirellula sp.]